MWGSERVLGVGDQHEEMTYLYKGDMSMGMVVRHQDLEVYKLAFAAAMEIFQLSKPFPKEETYSLTDQIRRSSRSVSSNIAEAWRKRRYEAAFISKLSN